MMREGRAISQRVIQERYPFSDAIYSHNQEPCDVKSYDPLFDARGRRGETWRMQLAKVTCGTEAPSRAMPVTISHQPG